MVGFETRTFRLCKCQNNPIKFPNGSGREISVNDFMCKWLVEEGLFPLSASQPKLAVSIPLLQFIGHLKLRSGDAITSVADALKAFYKERGVYITNERTVSCIQFRS